MSEWQEFPFGDLATLSNGANFTKDSFGAGLKILGVRDFGDRTVPDWSAMDEVESTALSSDRQLLAEGDLVFVRSNGNPALVGRSMLVTGGPRATHSAFTIKARPNRGLVIPRFLAYQMRNAHRVGLMRAANGTNITNLSQPILAGVRVRVPSLATQAKVLEVLGAIDDLIENNERRVQILEGIARAVYREWFVRFRYPGHESVPVNDFASGTIPEGWEVKKLVDIAEITMGQSPSSEHFNDDGIGRPFHQGVTGFGANFPTTRKWSAVGGRTAREGDILVSVRAPVGRINVADVDITIGRGLSAIRARDGRQALLLGHIREIFAEEDSMGNDGAIFKSLGKAELHSLPIAVAPSRVADAAESPLADNLDLIRLLSGSTARLVSLRDVLLPKLVTGQIDVSGLDIDILLDESPA